MFLSAPLISIIKYSFLGLIVTGAGFLIANTAVTMHYKSEKLEYLAYESQPFPRNESLSLHQNSLLCLTHPTKPFCLLSSKKRLKLLKNRQFSSRTETDSFNSSVFYLLMKDFVDFCNVLGVRPILLEPSILFCMQSTFRKYTLLSNNLQTKILHGSPDTTTFAVFEKDSKILTQERSVEKSAEFGLEFSRPQKWFEQNAELVDVIFTYTRQNLTVTVLVFFQKETFVWHPAPLEEESSLQLASSQAHENFTAVPFLLEDGHPSSFYLPSEVTNFLLQIQNSEFEECQPLRESDDTVLTSHPTLTHEQLDERVLIAIQELKSVFRPMLVTFWLWGDTWLGWNESCSLFQKTSEFYVAVTLPVSAVSKIDLNRTFLDNEYLHLVENHKWDDFQLYLILDCYGLRIRVTAIYEDHDFMWNYEKDYKGNLIKNHYPKRRLCSTSVLGQLVHKPCSTQASS